MLPVQPKPKPADRDGTADAPPIKRKRPITEQLQEAIQLFTEREIYRLDESTISSTLGVDPQGLWDFMNNLSKVAEIPRSETATVATDKAKRVQFSRQPHTFPESTEEDEDPDVSDLSDKTDVSTRSLQSNGEYENLGSDDSAPESDVARLYQSFFALLVRRQSLHIDDDMLRIVSFRAM